MTAVRPEASLTEFRLRQNIASAVRPEASLTEFRLRQNIASYQVAGAPDRIFG